MFDHLVLDRSLLCVCQDIADIADRKCRDEMSYLVEMNLDDI